MVVTYINYQALGAARPARRTVNYHNHDYVFSNHLGLGQSRTHIGYHCMNVVRLFSLQQHTPTVSYIEVHREYERKCSWNTCWWCTFYTLVNLQVPGRYSVLRFLSGLLLPWVLVTSLGLGDTWVSTWWRGYTDTQSCYVFYNTSTPTEACTSTRFPSFQCLWNVIFTLNITH